MPMVASPEPLPEKPVDFRAPPPSPIGTGRRSSVTNEDALTEFLQTSLRVPDLVLPDRIFPRQKCIESPPSVDLRLLESPDGESVTKIFESIAGIGCFQVVNHGIPADLIRSAIATAAGIFRVPPEKRVVALRSPEKPYGFEEMHGGEDGGHEIGQEFVWCKDECLASDMEGVWPVGYSNFSETLKCLATEIEKVAEKVLAALCNDPPGTLLPENWPESGGSSPPICYVQKHLQNASMDQWVRSLRYDVIRMLIRGADVSHALCVHVVFDRPSEFHVYSKRGWVSFAPHPDALVITAGDQIQAWSGGKYKHVIGRPIYKDDGKKSAVSMSFLCSPPVIISSKSGDHQEKSISLSQQAMIFLCLVLAYHFFLYISKKF